MHVGKGQQLHGTLKVLTAQAGKARKGKRDTGNNDGNKASTREDDVSADRKPEGNIKADQSETMAMHDDPGPPAPTSGSVPEGCQNLEIEVLEDEFADMPALEEEEDYEPDGDVQTAVDEGQSTSHLGPGAGDGRQPNNWKHIYGEAMSENLKKWCSQEGKASPIVILLPCCGIDGATRALEFLGIPFVPHAYDIVPDYKDTLVQHFTAAGVDMSKAVIKTGDEGDITKLTSADLDPGTQALCAGPPCQPWSTKGRQEGEDDTRFKALNAFLAIFVILAKYGTLKCMLLENVPGTTTYKADDPEFKPIYYRILLTLQDEVPEFVFDLDFAEAHNNNLGAARKRAVLKGIRNDCVTAMAVPLPLADLGRGDLRRHLTDNLPNIKEGDLTPRIHGNLAAYQTWIRQWVQEHGGPAQIAKRYGPGSVACFDADRSADKVYKQSFKINLAPCLTTGNCFLTVMSLEDIEKDLDDMKLVRFLSRSERCTLMGIGPNDLNLLSNTRAVKATGNMYPVPIIVNHLLPMLNSVANTAGFHSVTPWIQDPLGLGSKDIPQVMDHLKCRLEEMHKSPALQGQPRLVDFKLKALRQSPKFCHVSTKNKRGRPAGSSQGDDVTPQPKKEKKVVQSEATPRAEVLRLATITGRCAHELPLPTWAWTREL